MYSKKSEKRKKKKKPKKPKKPKRIARERRPAGLPGMFPSPIMGSNSVVYQPAPMPREDPVAQINIRNTEAVRNRLLLEQVTDLVAPQRRPETLALSNPPNVESSPHQETLNKIPPYRDKPPPTAPPKRSSSAPIQLRFKTDRTPIAGVGTTRQKISEVGTKPLKPLKEAQRTRRTKAEMEAGLSIEQAAQQREQAAKQPAKSRSRSLTRKGI